MNARLQSTPTETYVLDVHQAIGQIAVQLPGATAIFRRHKLDFCCGGQVSLAQATSEKGLDVQMVMGELAAIQRTDAPLEHTSASALIDHILARYHAVHREQLPELIRMARRVEAVHRDNPQVPNGLAAVLEDAEQDLLSHMMKEESILFPVLKAGGGPLVMEPMGMLRAEHTQHGAMLEKLMALSNNANPPHGACNTWRALYAGIAQFHDDRHRHQRRRVRLRPRGLPRRKHPQTRHGLSAPPPPHRRLRGPSGLAHRPRGARPVRRGPTAAHGHSAAHAATPPDLPAHEVEPRPARSARVHEQGTDRKSVV